MFMATLGSVLYFLSIYFQDVRGYDPLQTGIAFLLPTAVVVAGSPVAGNVVTRIGLKSTLVVALVMGAVGIFCTGARDLERQQLQLACAGPRRDRHRGWRRVH